LLGAVSFGDGPKTLGEWRAGEEEEIRVLRAKA
jgi:hypothetical protein